MESDANEVINSPADDAASPRTVRSNWLVFSWNQISQASRVLLVLSLSVAVIQIIATITSLCLGKNESCGKPLQSYLIIYVIRVALSFPLLIYQHLFKRRPRGTRTTYTNYNTSNDENSNNQSNSANNSDNNITEPGMETRATEHNSDTVPTAEAEATTTTTNSTTATTSPTSSSHSTASSTDIGNRIRWADRIKSLLDLFAILLFIIGNYLAFSSSTCARQAPTLFYTVLAWILLGYMIVLVPVVICASVIFCLPCVLVIIVFVVAIRTFNVNVSTVVVGGSKEEIAKIPVFKYKAEVQQQEENDNNDTISTFSKNNGNTRTSSSSTSSSSSSSSVLSDASHKQHKVKHKERSINTTGTNNSNNGPRKSKTLNKILGFFSRQHRKNKEDAEKGKKFKTLTITRQDDAVCTICLCDYENDDLVCKLWCNHHYHKDCVQEWLELNSKCPLCKRDFRGKDYVSSSNDDED